MRIGIHCAIATRALRAAAALALLVSSLPSPAQAQDSARWTNVPRVVVFGDVHGAYAALVDLLREAGVVDADLGWTGGDTHLVSLGDLVDRGPDSRAVIELLMRLQDEAPAHGGRVHVVLGNHELMDMIGDLRYVSAGEYAAFAADETDAMRDAAFAAFPVGTDEDAAAARARFDAAYPRGYFAHRAAFAADGRYGAWLLSLPAIIVVNDTAYAHGGLPPLVAQMPIETLNRELQADLRRYLELRAQLAAAGLLSAFDMSRDHETAQAALATASPELAPLLEEFVALGDAPELSLDGPLWYRGSVYCKPLLEEPVLDAALAQIDARRVVVGHTPTSDLRVQTLYDGRLVMLDTGMLADYYGGRAAALVLDSGAASIQYLSPPERAPVDLTGAADARVRAEAQLLEALGQGAVTATERGATEGAAWRVTLTYENRTLDALFYPHRDGGNGELELAAAALDDLLGTALVPPTAPRTIDGESGALQLRFADAITETQRLERGLGFSGWCPIEPQLQLMYTFDVLTLNRGRSADNVVYSNELSDLTVTDHRLAFGTARTLPQGFDPSTIAPPAPLVAALRRLDAAALETIAGEWLDSRRIRALLARRDRLLAGR